MIAAGTVGLWIVGIVAAPSTLTPYALSAVRLPASQIARQLEEFKGKVAGMNSRWQELKPKGGPSGNPAVVLAKITEYANAIKEMREESAKLQKEVGSSTGTGTP